VPKDGTDWGDFSAITVVDVIDVAVDTIGFVVIVLEHPEIKAQAKTNDSTVYPDYLFLAAPTDASLFLPASLPPWPFVLSYLDAKPSRAAASLPLLASFSGVTYSSCVFGGGGGGGAAAAVAAATPGGNRTRGREGKHCLKGARVLHLSKATRNLVVSTVSR